VPNDFALGAFSPSLPHATGMKAATKNSHFEELRFSANTNITSNLIAVRILPQSPRPLSSSAFTKTEAPNQLANAILLL
jgi:hypothetical protein